MKPEVGTFYLKPDVNTNKENLLNMKSKAKKYKSPKGGGKTQIGLRLDNDLLRAWNAFCNRRKKTRMWTLRKMLRHHFVEGGEL